jgi:hypothetical protein
LVARLTGGQEVAGSSPVAPIPILFWASAFILQKADNIIAGGTIFFQKSKIEKIAIFF